MQINIPPRIFASWIADVLRAEMVETSSAYEFDMGRFKEIKPSLDKGRLSEVIAKLQSLDVSDETTLWDSRSYEVLLRDESPNPHIRMRMRDEAFTVSDDDNGLTYTLSQPSSLWASHLIEIEVRLNMKDLRQLFSSNLATTSIRPLYLSDTLTS